MNLKLAMLLPFLLIDATALAGPVGYLNCTGQDTYNFAWDGNDTLQLAEADTDRASDNTDGRLSCNQNKCRIQIGRETWKGSSLNLITKKLSASNAYVVLQMRGVNGNQYSLPKYSSSSRYFEQAAPNRDCKSVAAEYAWYDWSTGEYERTKYQVKPTDRVSIRTWFNTYVEGTRNSTVRHASMDAEEATFVRMVPANGSECLGHNRTARIYTEWNGNVLQSVGPDGLGDFGENRDVVTVQANGIYADSQAQLFDIFIPRVESDPTDDPCLHHGDEFSLISQAGDWVWASNAGDIRNLSSNDEGQRTSFWAIYEGKQGDPAPSSFTW